MINGASRLSFTNAFETTVYYKNGATEKVLHVEPPVPDQVRLLHFKISPSCGVAINLDDVRKFQTTVKSIATPVERDVEIIQ